MGVALRVVIAFAVPLLVVVRAQSPTFEAASVKPIGTDAGMRGFGFPGDRFEATNALVRTLIAIAYGDPGQLLVDSRLVGGPKWIETERFDVRATAPGASIRDRQLMLRRVLEQRDARPDE